MNFIPPGTQVTAAHWNDIFQAADTALTNALGGLSAVFCGVDKQWDRSFFFLNPLTFIPALTHPLAAKFLAAPYTNSWGLRQYHQQALYFRQYDHAAITSAVGGLTTLSSSATYGIAKLAKPTWAAWSAAIYPSGFSSLVTQDMFTGTVPADNILDVSLGVIRAGGYAVTFNDITTAEHAQPLKPIDVYIAANQTWDNTNWDKYSIVRVHNCGRSAHTIFGTSIQSGGSRCFRKIAGSWQAQGNYFHWMQAGDGRFAQMREASGGAPSIFQPALVADLLWTVLSNASTAANFGKYFDPQYFFDLSPVYNNSAYTPTMTEKTPPAGGWLPALSMGAMIGDLLVPHGEFIVANHYLSTFTRVQFTGFSALAAALAAAGVSARAVVQTVSGFTLNNVEFYEATTRLDLVDTGCPLATFLTAGTPARTFGAMGSGIMLPQLQFGAITVLNNPSSANYSFFSVALDSGGNPILGATQTRQVNYLGCTIGYAQKPFLPTDNTGTVGNWMVGTSTAGGILALQNFALMSTVFGPVMTWDDVWPLDARFTYIGDYAYWGMPVKTVRVVLDQSQAPALRATRAVFLNECRLSAPVASGVWPPSIKSSQLPSQSMLWNFARTDQAYIATRYFYHDPTNPYMPNWTAQSQGGTSNYATFKSLPVFGTTFDDLTGSEWNVVKAFYETAPISVDTVAPVSAKQKTGISRMGAFAPGCDIWGPFAAWLAGSASLTYPLAPDFMGGTGSISIGAAWYGYPRYSAVLANTNIANPIYTDPVPIAPNALACQAEHFNLVAGLVNALPAMKLNYALAGNTSFTLNFASANIVIVNGGGGYNPGDSLGYGLTVGTVNGSGAVLTVAGAGVVNTYYADATPARPFACTGSGAYIDTTSGDGSALSFIPAYGPIGVPTPASGTWTAAWPRNAFFSWNGATPGCADPVGVYLAGLGATVQSALPDSYGASCPNFEYMMDGSGAITNTTIQGYAFGCDALFQVKAATYRWITIDDARTLYAAFSLPFVLNATCLPLKWKPTSIGGSLTSISSSPGMAGSGGDMGAVNMWVADFFTDPAGSWLRAYDSGNICAASSPCAEPFRYVVPNGDSLTSIEVYGFPYGEFTPAVAAFYANTFFPPGGWDDACFAWRDLSYAWLFGGPTGPLQFFMAVNLPGKPMWGRSAAVILREGLPDLCVAAIPQNAAYYDTLWAANNVNTIHELGSGVVPIIPDNSIEFAGAEVMVVPGAGGAGKYDHVFTTGLLNARLVTTPIDGAIAAPIPGGNL